MIEFHVDSQVWTDSVQIYAKEQIDGIQYAYVAAGINRVKPDQGGLWPKFLDLPMIGGATQSLFDALWKAGYRPNKGEASAAHVEAMRAHLEDMRTLVFKK